MEQIYQHMCICFAFNDTSNLGLRTISLAENNNTKMTQGNDKMTTMTCHEAIETNLLGAINSMNMAN